MPLLLRAGRGAALAETHTAVLARIHRAARRRTGFTIVVVRTPATTQLPDARQRLAAVIIRPATRYALDRRHRFAAVVIRASSEYGRCAITGLATSRPRLWRLRRNRPSPQDKEDNRATQQGAALHGIVLDPVPDCRNYSSRRNPWRSRLTLWCLGLSAPTAGCGSGRPCLALS